MEWIGTRIFIITPWHAGSEIHTNLSSNTDDGKSIEMNARYMWKVPIFLRHYFLIQNLTIFLNF
jgi:hypothetical protein